MSDNTVLRSPFNVALLGTMHVGLMAMSVPGTPKVVQYLSFPLLACLGYYLITQTTSDPPQDFGIGSLIVNQLFASADSILFTPYDSVHDLYRKREAKVIDLPFWKRLQWAFHYYVNPRGIGWTHQAPNTPPGVPSGTPRLAFVIRQISRAVWSFAVVVIFSVINASNPAMTDPTIPLTESPLIWRALGVAGFCGPGSATMNCIHCLISASVVGLGFSTPERWPNFFGSFWDAWSVARVWSKVWHHLLRQPIRSWATFMTNCVLGPPVEGKQRSTARKIFWLCCAFFTSAIIHTGGERMLLGHIGYRSFTFFMLQPLGIIIETFVGFLWSKRDGKKSDDGLRRNGTTLAVKPSLWIRCVGYLWVATWFTWSAAIMIEILVPTGMFTNPQIDLRQVRWNLGGMYVYMTLDHFLV